MNQEEDLSKYAAFDVDDIVAETASKKSFTGEATAYLDRHFLIKMIKEHHRQNKLWK